MAEELPPIHVGLPHRGEAISGPAKRPGASTRCLIDRTEVAYRQ